MATRFLLNNYVDTAALLDEPPMYAGLPVDNVKKLSKSLVARSISSTVQVIKGNLSNPYVDVNGFVIAGHNFTAGVTYRLELFNDRNYIPGPSRIYDSGTITVTSDTAASTNRNIISSLPIWIPTTKSNIAAFRLTINIPTGNGLPAVQIYRLFLGNYIEATVGASIGHSWSLGENTEQYRTESGTLRSNIMPQHKIIDFALDTITNSERSALSRALASVGLRKEFFISVFASDTYCEQSVDYSGVVKLTKVPKYIEFANNTYSSKFTVEEV